MIGNASDSGWATEVVKFMSENIPRDFDNNHWDHCSISAFQKGCEALIALGQAHESYWGAAPREDPELPRVLPRWDDMCIAVLKLGDQQDMIDYRLPDGSPLHPAGDLSVISKNGRPFPPLPAPNIKATDGLGPAHVGPKLLPVLQALGLIAGGSWTNDAETVLWRVQPRAWNMDVISDSRFQTAAQVAMETLPHDIRIEIDRLVAITDEDVTAELARNTAWIEEHRAKFGPKARIIAPMTLDENHRSLITLRNGELDLIFLGHWRLPDGWLSEELAERTLGIFHDPLAIQMRRAVIERLHPDLTEFHK